MQKFSCCKRSIGVGAGYESERKNQELLAKPARTLSGSIAFNVPLNDALAIAKPDSPDGADLWAKYLTNWTLWNHVRTVTSLAAAAMFAIALSR